MAGNGASRDPLLARALADPAREPDAVRPWVRLAPAADSLCPPEGRGFPSTHVGMYAKTIPQEQPSDKRGFSQNFSRFSGALLPLCIGKAPPRRRVGERAVFPGSGERVWQ